MPSRATKYYLVAKETLFRANNYLSAPKKRIHTKNYFSLLYSITPYYKVLLRTRKWHRDWKWSESTSFFYKRLQNNTKY